jgi:hypothetical protein
MAFNFPDQYEHTLERRRQATHRFRELFGPDTELYPILCPFSAVFSLEDGTLVKASTGDDGCDVRMSFHKNIVVV